MEPRSPCKHAVEVIGGCGVWLTVSPLSSGTMLGHSTWRLRVEEKRLMMSVNMMKRRSGGADGGYDDIGADCACSLTDEEKRQKWDCPCRERYIESSWLNF